MTPIRIHVSYCVSMKKSSTIPMIEGVVGVLFELGTRVRTGTECELVTVAACAGVRCASW